MRLRLSPLTLGRDRKRIVFSRKEHTESGT